MTIFEVNEMYTIKRKFFNIFSNTLIFTHITELLSIKLSLSINNAHKKTQKT